MGNKQKTVEPVTIEELRDLSATFGLIQSEYGKLVARLEEYGIDLIHVSNTKSLKAGLELVRSHYLAVAKSIEAGTLPGKKGFNPS